MQVHPLVEQRVDNGESEGAAEIAGQVEETGGVLDLMWRHGPKRKIVDRNHAKHEADAAQDLRHEQVPEIPVLRDVRGDPCARGEQEETESDHRARIDLGHQPT